MPFNILQSPFLSTRGFNFFQKKYTGGTDRYRWNEKCIGTEENGKNDKKRDRRRQGGMWRNTRKPRETDTESRRVCGCTMTCEYKVQQRKRVLYNPIQLESCYIQLAFFLFSAIVFGITIILIHKSIPDQLLSGKTLQKVLFIWISGNLSLKKVLP